MKYFVWLDESVWSCTCIEKVGWLPLVGGVYFRLATEERLSNQGDVVITSKSREQDYQWILEMY